jgi:hypothetical protein
MRTRSALQVNLDNMGKGTAAAIAGIIPIDKQISTVHDSKYPKYPRGRRIYIYAYANQAYCTAMAPAHAIG